MPGGPTPGWYADPQGRGTRWWDGAAWTSHVDSGFGPAELHRSGQTSRGGWPPALKLALRGCVLTIILVADIVAWRLASREWKPDVDVAVLDPAFEGWTPRRPAATPVGTLYVHDFGLFRLNVGPEWEAIDVRSGARWTVSVDEEEYAVLDIQLVTRDEYTSLADVARSVSRGELEELGPVDDCGREVRWQRGELLVGRRDSEGVAFRSTTDTDRQVAVWVIAPFPGTRASVAVARACVRGDEAARTQLLDPFIESLRLG